MSEPKVKVVIKLEAVTFWARTETQIEDGGGMAFVGIGSRRFSAKYLPEEMRRELAVYLARYVAKHRDFNLADGEYEIVDELDQEITGRHP
jgi:hypothetical protein